MLIVHRVDALRENLRLSHPNTGDTEITKSPGGFPVETKIISIDVVPLEPLAWVLGQLRAAAQNDPACQVVPVALGDENPRKTEHCRESENSSLVVMLPRHREAAPTSSYIDTEEITVRTLDSPFNEYHQAKVRSYLKIDAHGHEQKLLAGARASLRDLARRPRRSSGLFAKTILLSLRFLKG